MNEQQNFWANEYGHDYICKNQKFDHNLGVEGLKIMFQKAKGVEAILECGCNIGRNINFLNSFASEAKEFCN